ncbi:MAG: hypothetical protein K8I29_08360 [Alphaproteobacteria bacterium]|uniref:Uncharacterized protein n=1 Tax=Candidatus Nitrobium versatile TaxID=2884831 RepID=A0A953JCR2_9BACT|nr:hypothetical protein [Candidatus Nitrobium versatile]
MNTELAVYEEKPLTAQDIREQINLIQEVMRTVMQEGQHYGKIPGAGDKPTLFKPGAEKIMALFRLSADPEVVDLSHDDIIRYRVKCRLTTRSGIFFGAGLGECSSEEEKYKWRLATGDEEWEATPETQRRIKYSRDRQLRQVRTNPYELANTILKMAKKRALVDAVLTSTAASDIFTQDIEDMPEELFDRGKPASNSPRPPLKQPQAKSGGTIREPNAPATEAQIKAIFAIMRSKGYEEEAMIVEANKFLDLSLGLEFMAIESLKELTKGQASALIDHLQKQK